LVKPLAVASPSTLSFVAVAPCRLADTRAAYGFTGQYGPPSMAATVARNFTITGQCGIPVGASAVSFNFTAAGTLARGYLTVYPQGATPPNVSTLNYTTGETIANAAVVPLGVSGGIAVYAAAGLDLIIDVNGYYAPGAAGGFVTSANNIGGYDLDSFVSPSGTISVETDPILGENLNSMIAPTACTADFRATVDNATLGTLPITFTLRVNSVDTFVSCTLATDSTSCSSGNGAALAAGDKVTLHLMGGNGTYGAANTLWISMRCQ
jgi:hypothetical protein